MGWQHVSGDTIAVRQEKTDTSLLIPIHPHLAEALAAVPRSNLTFLVTERGAPFTSAGFGNWFRDQCNAAGLPQCSAHGLRKAAATRLANAGCSNEQIKAITGHRSDSALAPYTRAANQRDELHSWARMSPPCVKFWRELLLASPLTTTMENWRLWFHYDGSESWHCTCAAIAAIPGGSNFFGGWILPLVTVPKSRLLAR
jgi:hypothetical protein